MIKNIIICFSIISYLHSKLLYLLCVLYYCVYKGITHKFKIKDCLVIPYAV